MNSTKLYEDDNPFLVCLDLGFPNKKCVHFELSTEKPSQIFYIYLNNGDNLENLFLNEAPGKLQRIGIINDPDGFTNVREKPDIDSKIVSKFLKNEIFWYTPIGDSNWWPVYKENAPLKILGYVYKSKISSFKNFPAYLKEKLIKRPHG